MLLLYLIASRATGQSTSPPTGQSAAPGPIKLTGDNEKLAKQLGEQIDKALKADRWDEAIARAEELLALRVKVLGSKHFEAVSSKWSLNTLRRVASMSKEDGDAFQSVDVLAQQADTLLVEGKYATAQSLFQKALDIERRLLGDEHPDTATAYLNLATVVDAQGKYAEARMLAEKALAIDRRLFTDEHPQRFKDLSQKRERASIALGEFRAELVQQYGLLAGKAVKHSHLSQPGQFLCIPIATCFSA
jgi:tetratricopeptide (TPR) repeat protein